jgi:hypothetical protein
MYSDLAPDHGYYCCNNNEDAAAGDDVAPPPYFCAIKVDNDGDLDVEKGLKVIIMRDILKKLIHIN